MSNNNLKSIFIMKAIKTFNDYPHVVRLYVLDLKSVL